MASEPFLPSLPASASPVVEHARPATAPPDQHGPSYTAWHPLLAQVLLRVLASPALEVHPFVKLGTLPLEADIILLRRHADADLLALFPEFDFLLQFLKSYLIIEYKSPLDRLERADFDTVRAYAMLCKRKYKVADDGEIAVALLYSQLEERFFDACANNGFRFRGQGAGIWICEEQPLHLYAIDLTAYGGQHPEHPINLFSKRHRSYRPADGRWQRLLGDIQQHIIGEMKAMHARLRGQEELDQTFEEWEEHYLANLSVEKRLRGLPPEDRLRGLPPEDRLRGLPPEDRLRGLPPEDRLRGLPSEDRLRGLPPEDRLRGLSAEERRQLRELLEREAPPKS